ncbi:class I SAM-dependent methyltransferase [Streptomyces sp. NPDC013012]|uniref:class I SAM-dependent methyltransferase n=1 Tax=Streptomyces sp. NPDC013012 TaxID=3364860 RepID=UPI0036B409DD
MHDPTPEERYGADGEDWDERVPAHAAGPPHDLDAFRAGEDVLRGFEVAEVGDVTGRTLLHLQCRTGLETLSWARRGAAHVVGLDPSERAVETARSLAADLGLTQDRAAFVAADVYDAAEAVPDGSYDVVYTGGGALRRLPDAERWAETAASLVAPGGFLYLAEFHPLADSLDDETGSRVVRDYFVRDPWTDTAPGAHADSGADRAHPVGEVVTALARAGLRIDFLHEHDVSSVPRYGTLQRHEDGCYRFPADRPRVPLMYSVRASRPARPRGTSGRPGPDGP